MKQVTIEQLLLVAGRQEYTQTMALSVSQVTAMLEAAYEAGLRDRGYMTEPLSYPTSEDLCQPHRI